MIKEIKKEIKKPKNLKKVHNFSKETIEKSKFCKNYIEQKYKILFEEEKLKKEYMDNLVQKMNEFNFNEEEKNQIKLKIINKESELYREKRNKKSPKDFESLAIIGKGAFGEVRLCKSKENNELVAIKKMKKYEMIKKNQIVHIRAERDILAKAKNPWIVNLKYSFTNEKNLYLVMEYLPGGDLMNLLIKKEILSEEEAKFYIAEIILAVSSVHNLNYIHRDLKPDNILIQENGHIKLSDFGLCKYYQSTKKQKNNSIFELTNKSPLKEDKNKLNYGQKKKIYQKNRNKVYSLVGTPDYIAPEVFGKNGYSELVDWWSVGSILFEMVCGFPPFYADNPSDTCKKVLNWKKYFEIPKEINLSEEIIDLLKKLMTDSSKRLGKGGVDEIKNHKFFKNLDWNNIKKLKPPFVPKIKNELDTENFPTFDDEEDWIEEDFKMNKIKKYNRNIENEYHFIGYTLNRNIDKKRKELKCNIIEEISKIKKLKERQKSEGKYFYNNHEKPSNSVEIEINRSKKNNNSPTTKERYEELLREKNRDAFKKNFKNKDKKVTNLNKIKLTNIDNHKIKNSPKVKYPNKNVKQVNEGNNLKKKTIKNNLTVKGLESKNFIKTKKNNLEKKNVENERLNKNTKPGNPKLNQKLIFSSYAQKNKI